jgi:hypothetical protein
MNLFELALFLVMVGAVILGSRELERFVAIPEALGVPLIIGILILALRVLTRIRSRLLLYLSALLAAVSFISMGLAKALDLRAIFMIPVSTGLILIVIRGAFLIKQRRKASSTHNGV